VAPEERPGLGVLAADHAAAAREDRVLAEPHPDREVQDDGEPEAPPVNGRDRRGRLESRLGHSELGWRLI
jgi:hypothetical protein